MKRTDVLGALQTAAKEVLAEAAPTLSYEMELGEGTVDSLDLIEILMIVEERYQVQLDAEDYADLQTVGSLVSMLESKLPEE